MPQPGRLHPLHDRQHDRGRVDEEIQLHQAKQWPHPGNGLCQRGKEIRISFYERGHERLQCRQISVYLNCPARSTHG
jgi:hypothetical protein